MQIITALILGLHEVGCLVLYIWEPLSETKLYSNDKKEKYS